MKSRFTLFVVVMAVTLIGAGCAKPPPATLDEIKKTQIEGPVTFEPPAREKDPNDIYTMQTPARPETVKPLPGVLPPAELDGKKVRIKTAKGDIVFVLLGREAPIAASNFIWLTEQRFYNGLTFHRVEPGFVIQGGDPNGDGTGGPGYRFADEKVRRPYREGTVAMANSGPDTNGSQFFITLADQPNLPPKYTVFGVVLSGMEVVRAIQRGDVMASVTIE